MLSLKLRRTSAQTSSTSDELTPCRLASSLSSVNSATGRLLPYLTRKKTWDCHNRQIAAASCSARTESISGLNNRSRTSVTYWSKCNSRLAGAVPLAADVAQ